MIYTVDEIFLQSVYYMKIALQKCMESVPFWEIVNKTASGHYHEYDWIDLLLNRKIEKKI